VEVVMSASLIQKILRDLLLPFSAQKVRVTDRSEMLALTFKIGQRIPFQNLMVTDVVFHNFF
jgi:hypothetical protein